MKMRIKIVQTRTPKLGEDLNDDTGIIIGKSGKKWNAPPVLIVLDSKGNRIGKIIDHTGLVLSYGKFYLEIEIKIDMELVEEYSKIKVV